jgi:hypothetical protein
MPLLIRFWRYTWAFPNTLIGLMLALPVIALGAEVRVVNGALEVGGGKAGKCLPASFPFAAITLGHVIIGIDHKILAHCRSHEFVHVRQYERWGILFIPLYLGSSLLQLLQGRNPYLYNHFEREACTLASQYDEHHPHHHPS